MRCFATHTTGSKDGNGRPTCSGQPRWESTRPTYSDQVQRHNKAQGSVHLHGRLRRSNIAKHDVKILKKHLSTFGDPEPPGSSANCDRFPACTCAGEEQREVPGQQILATLWSGQHVLHVEAHVKTVAAAEDSFLPWWGVVLSTGRGRDRERR